MENTKVVVIACERSVDLEAHLVDGSKLKEIQGCSVVRVPCSGMIQPRMIESAFNSGADGVMVMGCQIGDCYFREGNKFCRERLLGQRPPVVKKSVPRSRLAGLWMSAVQFDDFVDRVKDFQTQVAEELKKEPSNVNS